MNTSKIIEEVNTWLASPSNYQLTGNGPVSALESKIAKYYGKKYAICVSNGTMGLWAVLRAKGIENRKVAGPAITWGGSFSGALLLRNKILLLPSSDMGFNISPEHLELTAKRGEISAVIGVDLGGYPHDATAIREICDRYDIFYLADAAQSLGAFRNGCPASAPADAIVVSFGTKKTLSAGEGAAIITNDRKLYERIIEQSQHPFRQQKEIAFSSRDECGVNLRIHPVAAIIANASFEDRIYTIQQRAACIDQALNKLSGHQIVHPFQCDNVRPIWYRILLKPVVSRRKKPLDRLKYLLPGWRQETMERHPEATFYAGKDFKKKFSYSPIANKNEYFPTLLQLFPTI